MPCSSCAGRRKVIAQVISGNMSVKAGAKQIGASIKKDILSAKPNKTGLRVK